MSSTGSNISLSPKASFAIGLVGGVMVLCTVGFFILLAVVLRCDSCFAAGPGASDKAMAAEQPIAPTPTAPAPDEPSVGEITPVSEADHVRGAADASVTLIEYSDFECPFCSRFHPTMKQIMDEFEGQVRWVYRHYPLGFHAEARPAALASECAGEQGKFWEYADELYENQSSLGEDYYEELAAELGLNMSQFRSCLSSEKYGSKVSGDLSGGTAAGVQGTPGTIILGADGSAQLVPGALPFESVKMMVEDAL